LVAGVGGLQGFVSLTYGGDGGPATRAHLSGSDGMAVDGAGNLVIADTANNRIRVAAESTGTFYGQAMTAGDIYTLAGSGSDGYFGDGGPGPKARLAFVDDELPVAVAADGSAILITDTGNGVLREVSS
jgi:DNA-binding beta-propeller fold protein YncE